MKTKFLLFVFLFISSINIESRPLKILFATAVFPSSTGTAVLNQITGLIDRGHDVYIYALKGGKKEWIHPDVIKYRLLEKTKVKFLPDNIKNFDIIYAQFGGIGKMFARLKLCLNLSAKLVTCFRGRDASQSLLSAPKSYKLLFQLGTLFLPVCDYFKSRLIKLGCEEEKIVVHHSSIDCQKFSYKERFLEGETIRFVSVCRLVEKKGLEYSIRAVAKLVKQYPNIRYTIVGFGPLQNKLEALIAELNVQSNIKIVGRASETEVAQILNQSHVFILSSVTTLENDQEGIPNSLKEAMARGLPVVSTYHSGISELVEDGISGFLVSERDVVALIKKLKYLIRNPEIWRSMGLNGRAKVEEEYDKELLNDCLVKIFKNIIAG